MGSFDEGQALPEVEHLITRERIAGYADASGDRNPLHLDPEFSAGSQFGGVIAHGMMTLAFVSEMLTVAFGKSWLEGGSLKVRFKGAAQPGDSLRTWGTVVRTGKGAVECSVGLRNQHGEEVISGVASIIGDAVGPTSKEGGGS